MTGAGRFAFQLASPTVLLFFYVGYRFVAYAVQNALFKAMFMNPLHMLSTGGFDPPKVVCPGDNIVDPPRVV